MAKKTQEELLLHMKVAVFSRHPLCGLPVHDPVSACPADTCNGSHLKGFYTS